MDLNKTIEESLDGLWNNRQYGGTNESPRKDYQPYSTSQGYSYPYQAGGATSIPSPEAEGVPSTPWPLNTIETDLSDSFVYLMSAFNKMKTCLEENPSLKKSQKANLRKLIKFAIGALKRIEFIGMNIIKVSNIGK